jgi:DNA-binding MarR family transcriptional regulator
MSDDDVRRPLVAVERGMVRLRRGMSRRTLGALATRGVEPPFDLAHFSVVDAVEEGGPPAAEAAAGAGAAEGAEAGGEGEVTVGLVGERLAVDPSRASRLVAAAVKAGYVERVASQEDGRRIRLRLTAAGRELADAGHRARQRHFDRAMAGWSADERREFARLLTRFADGMDRLAASEPGAAGPGTR